jgi:hypothetical protein
MSAAAIVERCLRLGLSLYRDGGSLAVDEPADDALTDQLMAELREHKLEILALLARADSEAANTQTGAVDLARVLGPLSLAERERVRAGSLYREPEPDTSRAREASQPVSTVRVSFVERPPRHRLAKMRDDERHCAACKARGPLEGPLPFSWDVHALQGVAELALSCSPKCRVELGVRERKVS